MAIPDFFGLNLGHDSIKVSHIKHEGSPRLASIGSTPTVLGILDNDSEQGLDQLSKEIVKSLKNSNIATRNCVISVPEVSVFSRLLTLPKVADEEVTETIQYALKPLVPVPLENVNISFLEIDEKKVDGNTFVNWYVVAAPKQLIDKLQTIAEKGSINLLAVETEALAISRMIEFNYQSEITGDVMILDLGADSTNVILARNGIVMFSQNISTGGNSLTKVISADYGLDMIQAEKYKVTYGLDPAASEGKIAKSLEPILQIILSEIQRTITYFKEKIGGNDIQTVYLTGGGANLPKIDEYITQKLNVPTVVADPLKKLVVEKQASTQLPNLAVKSFNVSIGLSLKGII